MQIKIYEDAVKYLESFIGKVRFEITPEFIKKHDPLERMRVLLDLLGNPQEKFRSILVGGTSGKGSTAYLISHILTTAGYKNGLTISPHLQKVNERLQINCEPISDGKFTKMVGSIVDTIELMRKKEVGAPSYFEILIAMGFLYFAKEQVDIAVVEVGMGGEYDATNTLYPLIAVLTNVSLDHTNVLGRTVEKIARTKAGIVKGSPHPIIDSAEVAHENFLVRDAKKGLFSNRFNNPASSHSENFVGSPRQRFIAYGEARPSSLIVVTGVKQPSVIKIVEDRCRETGAEIYRLGKDFSFSIKKESLEGSLFDVTLDHGRGEKLHTLQDLQLVLLGSYQVENACLAIESVFQLEKFGFKVSKEQIRKAMKTAFFQGRFEIIKCHPEFILPVGRQVSGSRYIGKQKKMLKPASQRGEQVQHDKKKTTQIVLDGAHNPTKMRAFLTSLKDLFPKKKKIFIVGFKFDKDIPKMLKQIIKIADTIIVTQFRAKTDVSANASMEISNLKSQISNLKFRKDVKVIVLKNSKMALDKAFSLLAIQQLNNPTIIVVTGSLYLVGEVRNML